MKKVAKFFKKTAVSFAWHRPKWQCLKCKEWLQWLYLCSAILVCLSLQLYGVIWYQITSPIFNSAWTELKFLICLLCLLFHVTLSSIIFLKFVPMINLFHISARAVMFILSSCGHSAHVGGMGYSGPVIVALRVFFIYSNLSFIRNT